MVEVLVRAVESVLLLFVVSGVVRVVAVVVVAADEVVREPGAADKLHDAFAAVVAGFAD